MLTKKEISGAQMMFNNFDKDRDGIIDEKDIKLAYLSWYSHFDNSTIDEERLVWTKQTRNVDNRSPTDAMKERQSALRSMVLFTIIYNAGEGSLHLD